VPALHAHTGPLNESDFGPLREFRVPVKRLVIHHSVTGLTATVRSIHNAHRARGWSGIGYHVVLHPNGTPVIGRPLGYQGAGADGHNGDAYHLCLIGDGREGFTGLQWATLARSVEWFWQNIPNPSVWGHNELKGAQTLCPGFSVADWLRTGMKPGKIRT
jgi:hypothetical protein